MKKASKLIAVLLAASLPAGGIIPAMAADSKEMATREYVVSEFVQSVGRKNLTLKPKDNAALWAQIGSASVLTSDNY